MASRHLAPQLVPSRTSSERNFEQCSPSLARPRRQGHAPSQGAGSQVRTGHAVSPSLKQWLPDQPLCSFLVCIFGEQKDQPALTPS